MKNRLALRMVLLTSIAVIGCTDADGQNTASQTDMDTDTQNSSATETTDTTIHVNDGGADDIETGGDTDMDGGEYHDAAMPVDSGPDVSTATEIADTDIAEPHPEVVFNQPEILEYRFQMSENDFDHLEAHGDDLLYVPASLTIEGGDISESFDQVGIRHKGSYTINNCFENGIRSGSSSCAKLSYKVKFSEFNEDSRFHGYKRINLHAMSRDITKLRESLAYGLFNAFGINAPQTAYAKVYINDALVGLFLQVEQVDGRYTAFHFPDGKDGNLYKEVWPKAGMSDDHFLKRLKTNNNPEDNPDVSDILAFGEAIAGSTEETFESVMSDWVDIDHLLRYMAVDRAIRNWDGILTFYSPDSPHNFYWYHESETTGIFQLIPWDLDNTFWTYDPIFHPGDGPLSTEPVPNWNVLPVSCDPIPLWNPENTTKATPPGCDKLINLLAITGWDRFVTYGEELLNGPMSLDVMTTQIDSLISEIEQAVSEDPAIDFDEWKAYATATINNVESSIEEFRQHMREGYIVQVSDETFCESDSDCQDLGQICVDGICENIPTCDDGIQNGNEIGIDCGGPDCDACATANTLYFEAESGVLSGSPTFDIESDAAASGGQCITSSSTSANTAGTTRATYRVNLSEGNYVLWGRIFAPSHDSDSLWISVDDGPFVQWNHIPAINLWRWDDVHNSESGAQTVVYKLSTGVHTVVIANREGGIKLDRLYFTAIGDTPPDDDTGETCYDGIQNQNESSIDCGGTCAGCADGDVCRTWLDCASGFCSNNICTADATCVDGMKDGSETGVDCGGPDCNPCTEETPTAVYIEAESGLLLGDPGFSVGDDAGASGGQYLTATSDDQFTPGPNRASYTFTVDEGSYVIWTRSLPPDGTADSLWLRMDGGDFIMWNNITGSEQTWGWDKVNDNNSIEDFVTYELSAGTHVLEIANREMGLQLDRIYITSDDHMPE